MLLTAFAGADAGMVDDGIVGFSGTDPELGVFAGGEPAAACDAEACWGVKADTPSEPTAVWLPTGTGALP